MVDVARRLHMTAAEYLAWERLQPDRHELHDGEVFAMAGGTPRHNALVANVVGVLHAALRGGPCRVLSSDQRIAFSRTASYVYGDASVVCGSIQLQPDTTDVLENPSVIVEVLSKSTEAYDRGNKWRGYQQLASLGDYLLVSQDRVRVEHFKRDAPGDWRYRVVELDGTLLLSNGATLSVQEIYEGAMELVSEEG